MNQKTWMIGIIFMVLIGIVSGMLVSYVSNVISGGVEVGGPVFYLDGSDNS